MSIGNRAEIAGISFPESRDDRHATFVRVGIIVFLVIGLLGLSALAFSSARTAGSDAASPDSVATADGPLDKVHRLLAMISDRSPGARTTAELTKTKRQRAEGLPRTAPHERALGKIRRPLVPEDFLRALAPNVAVADVAPLLDLNPLIGVPGPQFALADAPPGGVIGGSPVVPIGGVGGGGGGGGSTPTPPTTTPPTVPSAVPEPGSWAMMLLGFLALGTQMKRARRLRQTDAIQAA